MPEPLVPSGLAGGVETPHLHHTEQGMDKAFTTLTPTVGVNVESDILATTKLDVQPGSLVFALVNIQVDIANGVNAAGDVRLYINGGVARAIRWHTSSPTGSPRLPIAIAWPFEASGGFTIRVTGSNDPGSGGSAFYDITNVVVRSFFFGSR